MVNTDFLNKLENEFGYPPNDTPSTILSFNLKTLRNVYSYSQEDLANKLGISIRAYRSYEKGITAPGKEVLDRIHDIFKLEQKSIYSYDLVCSIIKHDTLSDDVKKIFNEVLPLSDKSYNDMLGKLSLALIQDGLIDLCDLDMETTQKAILKYLDFFEAVSVFLAERISRLTVISEVSDDSDGENNEITVLQGIELVNSVSDRHPENRILKYYKETNNNKSCIDIIKKIIKSKAE